MAIGDVVGAVLQSMAPNASRADPGIRTGGSTPAENVPIVAFDDTSTEYWDFWIALEGYGGGGLTIEIPWTSDTATTGTCTWGIALRRFQDDAEDIDVSHTYEFNTVAATAPSAAGEVVYDTITFANGTDMDSLADGERAILRLRRNDGGLNMSGDAQLIWGGIIIRET